MKLAFIVGIGCFLGGISRYLLSSFIQEKTTNIFPYATLSVNLIGCFLIGCLFGLAEKWELNLELNLLFITGLLGGFTTFSAFSVEFFHLFKTGNIELGITYVLISVIMGIGFTFLGAWLFGFIPGRV
ncbi:MAG: fluoride efflux transporter CrcB [Ferruginibacter sp.]